LKIFSGHGRHGILGHQGPISRLAEKIRLQLSKSKDMVGARGMNTRFFFSFAHLSAHFAHDVSIWDTGADKREAGIGREHTCFPAPAATWNVSDGEFGQANQKKSDFVKATKRNDKIARRKCSFRTTIQMRMDIGAVVTGTRQACAHTEHNRLQPLISLPGNPKSLTRSLNGCTACR